MAKTSTTTKTAPVTRHVPSTIVPATCELVPLVDGPEIYPAMEKALLGAKEFIFLTAWLLSPDVVLQSKRFRALLKDKVKQGVAVRILWCDLDVRMGKVAKNAAGAAIETQLAKELQKDGIQVHVSRLTIEGKIRQTLESIASSVLGFPQVLASHHQKTLMMDGKFGPVGFCSGCDIVPWVKEKAGWHDASIMIKGCCGIGIIENFVERWNSEAKGDPGFKPAITPPCSCAHNRCKVVRTMPGSKKEILEAYLDVIGKAKSTIYLENQYLMDQQVGRALVEAAVRGVAVTIVVPAKPEEAAILNEKGKDPLEKIPPRIQVYSQYRILKALTAQTPSAVSAHWPVLSKLKFAPPANLKVRRPKTGKPYVHAKVVIVDDSVTLIGSANANSRSMSGEVDSELDVQVSDNVFSVALRGKLEASLAGTLTDYTSVMIEEDEKISRIAPADMTRVQALINGEVNKIAAAAAAVSASGSLYPESFYEAGYRWTELQLLDSALPGIKDALAATDPNEFRDFITDAAATLI